MTSRFAFPAFLLVLIGTFLFIQMHMPQAADIVFVNGRIYTMNPEGDVCEAFAVLGDRIAGAGSTESVRRRFVGKKVVDLKGLTVLPGLIDAHGHVLSLGLARMTVDLVGAKSEPEAASRVAARVRASKPGQWIRGRGWDQNGWPTRSFPGAASLDRVAPANPVYLVRVDGHACWVNSAALQIAGVTAATADPPGGKIVRGPGGKPSGVLVDAAMDLVGASMPPPSDAEMEEAIKLASQELISKGITTAHDMGADERTISMYRALADSGSLKVRLYVAIDAPSETWEKMKTAGIVVGECRNHLTVRAIKMYADGALGSRGAALLEPYSDDPANRGLTMASEETLRTLTEDAVSHGFQVCTHAIGDRANALTLDIYQKVLASGHPADARLRVEHAQILAPGDIGRFGKLHVIASMQPTHCTSDMTWAEARLGPKRIRGAYAWRSILDTGGIIAGGSDFPVEDPNPIDGIASAVTRKDKDGHPTGVEDVRRNFQLAADSRPDSADFADGWYSHERMTRMEAVRCFTTAAAYAGFEEGIKGSIEAGKLADVVILSADPFTVAPDQIRTVHAEKTFVGGVEVFSQPDARVW